MTTVLLRSVRQSRVTEALTNRNLTTCPASQRNFAGASRPLGLEARLARTKYGHLGLTDENRTWYTWSRVTTADELIVRVQ